MAVDAGAYHLLKPHGGRGVLLGGAPGVPAAKVIILGGGVSGKHAAEMAIGHRADVTLFDISAAAAGGAGRPVRRPPEDRLLHPRRRRRGCCRTPTW